MRYISSLSVQLNGGTDENRPLSVTTKLQSETYYLRLIGRKNEIRSGRMLILDAVLLDLQKAKAQHA